MLEKKKAEVGRTTLSEIEKLEVIADLIADVQARDGATRSASASYGC